MPQIIQLHAGRYTGNAVEVENLDRIPKGWMVYAGALPETGSVWSGGLFRSAAPPNPFPARRAAISARYDALIAAGLGILVPGIDVPITVMPPDVVLLGGGGAVAASRLSMWQAMGQADAYAADAAGIALKEYNFNKTPHTLTTGQFAALYLGYFASRDDLYKAHDRAKKACDLGREPDPADLALLGL